MQRLNDKRFEDALNPNCLFWFNEKEALPFKNQLNFIVGFLTLKGNAVCFFGKEPYGDIYHAILGDLETASHFLQARQHLLDFVLSEDATNYPLAKQKAIEILEIQTKAEA